MHIRHLFAKTVVCVGALSLIASCSKTEEPQAQGGSDTSAPAVTTDGTTGSSSPEDAALAAALTQAGEATQAKNTGKVSGTVEVTIGGAMLSDDPFESDPSAAAAEDVTMALSLEGSYDVEHQQSDTTVTVDELSGPSDALDGDSGPQAAGDTQQVITDGDVTYTREVSGGEVRLVDGKEWVRGEVEMSSSEPSVPGFSDTGIVDPRQLLAQLEETATEVTDEGTVEIDGVETTHYHAELSMADIAAQFGCSEIEAARRLGYFAVDKFVKSPKTATREITMAKLFAGDLMQRVLYDCMQVYGGFGYTTEYGIGRAWADARLITIGGGTSEVMKEILAKLENL